MGGGAISVKGDVCGWGVSSAKEEVLAKEGQQRALPNTCDPHPRYCVSHSPPTTFTMESGSLGPEFNFLNSVPRPCK